MGQVVGVRAIDLGLDKAGKSGGISVGVRRSNHYGAGAYYVQRAVARDAIAFAYSNAPPTMAPWGGGDPYFGTNPSTPAVPPGPHQRPEAAPVGGGAPFPRPTPFHRGRPGR